MSKSSLAEFREHYRTADNFRNEVEHFSLDAGIPAQTQLRYAGWHLMHALDDEFNLISKAHLAQATSHCKRSAYEAAETGILFSLEKIAKFKEDYSITDLTGLFPGFVDSLSGVVEAQELVKDGRTREPDRRDDWERGMKSFRKLREICNEFDKVRAAINPDLSRRHAALVRQDQRNLRAYQWTVAGTLLGLAGIALSFAIWWYS